MSIVALYGYLLRVAFGGPWNGLAIRLTTYQTYNFDLPRLLQEHNVVFYETYSVAQLDLYAISH